MSTHLSRLNNDLSTSPENGQEMVLLIRRIIHDWVNAGLPYPLDELDVLIGIESQSDHLLAGKVSRVFGASPSLALVNKEEDELKDLYEFFKERYDVARGQLIQRLKCAPHGENRDSN